MMNSTKWNFLYLLSMILPAISSSSFLDQMNFINTTLSKATSTTKYPQNALQCYSTLSTKNKKIICPKFRTNYCVKEVSNATRKECETKSSKQYSNDVWDPKIAKCIYRKCSDTCNNETIYYNETAISGYSRGKYWKRDVYCCDNSICNSCSGLKIMSIAWFGLFAVTIILL